MTLKRKALTPKMTKSRFEECMYCQLEKYNTLYYSSYWKKNRCEKHREGIADNMPPSDNIDAINIPREQEMKDRDDEAQDLKDRQFWK